MVFIWRATHLSLDRFVYMFNDNKIRVLVVAVDDYNPKKLLKLVKSPEHFFQAEKFEDLLGNITEIIGALICEGMIPQFYHCVVF